jgi:hypothetical protein
MIDLNYLAKQFEESIARYLNDVKPKYINKHFSINEREIQAYCWNILFKATNRNYRVKIEDRYSDQADKKQRFDLMVEYKENSENNLYIEIEWSARQTDGFATHTFSDLEKLSKCTPEGNYGMFLAVNISDKYKDVKKIEKVYYDPKDLPLKDQSALKRAWSNSKYNPLIQCHSKFWLSEYPHDIGKNNKTKYYVLVFACFGKKNKDGNWEE